MHKSLSDIGGSLTALVTPFRDGGIDWTALCRLAERQLARGTAALVICGSIGEAASLILSEYARAVRSVACIALLHRRYNSSLACRTARLPMRTETGRDCSPSRSRP